MGLLSRVFGSEKPKLGTISFRMRKSADSAFLDLRFYRSCVVWRQNWADWQLAGLLTAEEHSLKRLAGGRICRSFSQRVSKSKHLLLVHSTGNVLQRICGDYRGGLRRNAAFGLLVCLEKPDGSYFWFWISAHATPTQCRLRLDVLSPGTRSISHIENVLPGPVPGRTAVSMGPLLGTPPPPAIGHHHSFSGYPAVYRGLPIWSPLNRGRVRVLRVRPRYDFLRWNAYRKNLVLRQTTQFLHLAARDIDAMNAAAPQLVAVRKIFEDIVVTVRHSTYSQHKRQGWVYHRSSG
jgi:hypothetical protein